MSERFMGEFDPKATYKKGDVVTLNGEAYRRVRDDGGKVDPFQTMPYRVWQKKSAASGGLVNLLGPGGGGGTSDAVQYIPQELTESQQMQARKNLGVYYNQRDFVEVLPLTKVIPQDAGPMGYGVEVPGFEIIPEKRYIVDINGELFEVTPIKAELGGSEIYILGSRFDESSLTFVWDYPFAIMQLPYNLDVSGIYFQNAGEKEISVAEEGVVYHSIPPEYLPKVVVNLSADGTSVDMSRSDMLKVLDAGLTLVLRETSAGGMVVDAPFESKYPNGIITFMTSGIIPAIPGVAEHPAVTMTQYGVTADGTVQKAVQTYYFQPVE